MIDVGRIWRSSAGTKAVMAVTGMILFGFTIIHMLGNLNAFLGEASMNEYGAMLHAVPELAYVARIVLGTAVVLHIAAMVKLIGQSRAARPQGYKVVTNRGSTLYSRTMRITGPIVLLFIVLHLLNLTFHGVGGNFLHPDFKMQSEHAPDAFHNLTTLLRMPMWGIFYIVANACFGFHLWHGAVAMFRSLGLSGERQLGTVKALASGLTLAVAGGNVVIATSILVGLIK